MTRDELTDQLAEIAENSGLSLADKVYAIRVVLTRVQMNVSPQKIEELKSEKAAPRVIRIAEDSDNFQKHDQGIGSHVREYAESDELPSALRDVHGKVITEEHLKVAFTGFTPLARFITYEAAAPCSGGSAHCWHRSKIQHAMMNHRDEICCWCGSHQCVSLPVNHPEGHGQFLKETT